MIILTHLIKKRLAFGGPVFSGPAKFLWEKEIVEHDYCYVVTYTREDLKDRLTVEAESVSAEEVCMISFIPFEGNAALTRLLDSGFSEPRDAARALTKRRDRALGVYADRRNRFAYEKLVLTWEVGAD
jgi:hypothetical protein